ncbi:MAG: 5-formyltetrahydrofolate cyclo-ligase [Coriobacteriales bacterium]|jgi:5-formyltetrahydrofolate cyclo-ligase|nr:5-formyltetrahydrofolate cyclo-ligase [Coriobacteriales bacterium]
MPEDDIQKQKHLLRKRMLSLRSLISVSDAKRSDEAIRSQLLSLPQYKQAQMIFCYASTAKEVDTLVFINEALLAGKRICVPLCLNAGIMQAQEITSLNELSKGKMGILEPPMSAAVIPKHEIDMIVVPCVAADKNGFRLGYGGGYYDRYLNNYRTASETGHMAASENSYRAVNETSCRAANETSYSGASETSAARSTGNAHNDLVPFAVLLCRSQLLLDAVPKAKHDVCADLLITG